MSSADTNKPPCCKPLRFLELVIIIVCFTLLFFLRQFKPQDEIICSSSVLIFFFTAVGSSLVIALIDVLCQIFREPIPNSPMILSLLLAAVMCFTSGVTSLFVHSTYHNCKSLRNLNTLCILAGSCFCASLVYILDALVVIRFTC